MNIDMRLTEKALQELGIDNLSQHMHQSQLISFFKEYETGRINDASFIAAIRSLSPNALKDEAVVAAWNALLLDFPAERIELLRKLKKRTDYFYSATPTAYITGNFNNRSTGKRAVILKIYLKKHITPIPLVYVNRMWLLSVW